MFKKDNAWRTGSLVVMVVPPIRNIMPQIKVVAAYLGIEPLPYVLGKLGLRGKYSMEASCEIDARCRQVLQLCHKGQCSPQGNVQ
ncbi:MAG: hypothetical protein ACKPKO_51480 [Candidatus Fonsibacter sp.]